MRIAMMLPGDAGWGSVIPENVNRGMGGRETALVRLAEEWCRNGHQVRSFVPWQGEDGIVRMRHDSGGSATFAPNSQAPAVLSTDDYDAIISWEAPTLFTLPGLDERAAWIVAMQVAHVMYPNEEDAKLPDAWQVLSPWAEDVLRDQIPKDADVFIVPNCVDLTHYQTGRIGTRAKWHRFLYASSPDRGLIHVLRAWPRIREEFPKAELRVAYGVERWFEGTKWAHHVQGQDAVEAKALMEQDGIKYLGKIGQDQLAREHYASDALLYPCDTYQYTETGCITVMEAMAAGNVPVITDCDCLGEEFEGVAEIVPLPFDEDAYVAALVTLAHDRDRVKRMQARGREKILSERLWHIAAKKWLEEIQRVKAAKGLVLA